MERQNPLIMEGIPVHLPERRRTGVAVPPAPPPLEVSEVEPLIPLTQPLPREEEDPQPGRQKNPPSPKMKMRCLEQISHLGMLYPQQQCFRRCSPVLYSCHCFSSVVLRQSDCREGERCVENGRVSACMWNPYKTVGICILFISLCLLCPSTLKFREKCLGFSRAILRGLQEKLPFRCHQTSPDWITQDTVSTNCGCPSRTLESH